MQAVATAANASDFKSKVIFDEIEKELKAGVSSSVQFNSFTFVIQPITNIFSF